MGRLRTFESNRWKCYVCLRPGKPISDEPTFLCPRDYNRAIKWVKALNLNTNLTDYARHRLRLCGRHFEDTFFTTEKKDRLNWNAVPTLHLNFEWGEYTELPIEPPRRNRKDSLKYTSKFIDKQTEGAFLPDKLQSKKLLEPKDGISNKGNNNISTPKLSNAVGEHNHENNHLNDLSRAIADSEQSALNDEIVRPQSVFTFEEKVPSTPPTIHFFEIIPEKSCRICLETNKLEYIFENNIADKIMDYTGIKILKDDELPKYICSSCLSVAQQLHTFVEQIRLTDKQLRSKQPGNENIEDVTCFKQNGTNTCSREEKNKQDKTDSSVDEYKNHFRIKCEDTSVNETILLDKTETLTISQNYNLHSNRKLANSTLDQNFEASIKSKIENTHNENIDSSKEDDNKQDNTDSCVEYKNNSRIEMVDTSVDETVFSNKTDSLIISKNYNLRINRKLTNLTMYQDFETSIKSDIGDIAENIDEDTFKTNINFSKNENKTAFLCDICGCYKSSTRELLVHKTVHSSEKPYKCTICLKEFRLADKLQKHKIIHTERRNFKCSVCYKEFKHRNSIKIHERKHTNAPSSFKCNFCNRHLSSGNALKVHIKLHKGELEYSCTKCEKAFPSALLLKRHLHFHEKQNVIKNNLFANSASKIDINIHCSVCEKRFESVIDFKKHLSIEITEKRYQCEICAKKFQYPNQLRTHQNGHKKEPDMHCTICSKAFKYPNNLAVHMRAHSTDLSCKICTRPMASYYSLIKHMKIHTNERKFACTQCDKAFIDRVHLAKHLKMHEKRKLMDVYDMGNNWKLSKQCSICNKQFVTVYQLKRHLKMHTDEKPYICSYCGKCFKYDTSWSNHIRIHTGNKPYACEFCDKRFRNSSNCKRHVESHIK